MIEQVAVFAVDEVPPGEIRAARLPNGATIAVYNVDGAFYATQDRCTHGDASLSEDGTLCGKFVECSWHFGTFDVTNGEPGLMPCELPLKTYPVRLADGMIYIEYSS